MSTYGTFIQEDIDFLNDLNSGHEDTRVGLTVKHGYVRNLDRHILQQFENIYKRVINPDFVLCFHCSTEVLNMIREVYQAFEATQVEAEVQGLQPDLTQPDLTQPDLTQPDLTQPDLTQPDLTQPETVRATKRTRKK